jgi:hypothetical protein
MSVQPVRPRRAWIAAVLIAGAAVTVCVVVLIDHAVVPAASSAPTAQTAPAALTTPADVVTPTDFVASPSQVDALVAADGQPLDLAAGMTPVYPDAYAMIKDDCETMSSTTTAEQWLAAHLLNAAVPGEAEALRLGIPLVCPQFNVTLLHVENG